MKIAYIVNARIPTEKAHGYQISKMCEAFSIGGANVELVIPFRNNRISEDVFSYYNLSRVFRVRGIGSLALDTLADTLPFVGFRLRSLLFSLRLCFLDISKDTVIYSRDPEIVWLFGVRGYHTVFDVHRWPERRGTLFRYLIKHTDLVVANSRGTADACRAHGIKNVYIAHNAVDLSNFVGLDEKGVLRKKLDFPQDKKIVMYVGHLYRWKGVDAVIETAHVLLSRHDILFVLVGGVAEDVEKYEHIIVKRGLMNVRILGHQKKESIPKFLRSADILLLPNIPLTRESELYTSPIKMFEYMASHVPIIASNLPSLREVLNEHNAVLVKAGDPAALANSITNLLADERKRHDIAEAAFHGVTEHTWENRAQNIIRCIEEKCHE